LDKRDNRLAEGDGNANVYVIGDVMSQYGISFTDSAAQYCSIRKIQLGKRCLDQAAELCSFPPCERTSIACFSVRARRFCPAARLMKPFENLRVTRRVCESHGTSCQNGAGCKAIVDL
jgi:hypothetical protein